MMEASWEASSSSCSPRLVADRFSPRHAGVLDRLWEQMANDSEDVVLPVRNCDYIRHRYLSHPTRDYLVLLVRSLLLRRPYGLLVLTDHGDAGVELLDLVGPKAHFPNLITVARRMAWSLQRTRLFAMISEAVAEAIKDTSPRLTEQDIPIATNIWLVSSNVDCLRGKFWFTGGDTDFR
jgi:hypothetical protein